MKGKASENLTAIAMIALVLLGILFWVLLLSPKREEAAKLGKEVERVETSLAGHRAEVAEAEAARREFPADYQELVLLGKAVPGDDDTASLLVQLERVSRRAGVDFNKIELSAEGGDEESAPAPTVAVSPTEAAASLMPLGAQVGPAGLGMMSYALDFKGTWFEVADFVEGLDSLVKTRAAGVAADGRLITISSFTLVPAEEGLPMLEANFSVGTYLVPPGQPVAPELEAAPPAEPTSTVEGTP